MGMKAFLKSAATIRPNQQVAISERFIGEDGAPEKWELRPLTEEEDSKLRASCTEINLESGNRRVKFDKERYVLLLAAAAVVYPDLKDAELQKSYGVIGEDKLLSKMLYTGEFDRLTKITQALNGYDNKAFEAAMEEVKNS